MTAEQHNLIPASYLVLRDGDKVLLMRRFQTGYEDGNYSLPAGHVEKGETFTQALVREVQEEIGVAIDPHDTHVVHMMQRDSQNDPRYRLDMFFIANTWSGEVQNMEPHKCDELLWCDIDHLPDNTIAYIVSALTSIAKGEKYSEFGY